MMNDDEFRRIMGHFASGVTVVGTRNAARQPCGLTVSAFCSLSLDPMMVLVCVEHDSDSHDCIRDSGFFSVSMLDSDSGESLSRNFAGRAGPEKYNGIGYFEAVTGAPVLDDALAWLDCRVAEVHQGGDHTIFIGEVVAGDAREGNPLIYYRGGYGRLEP